MFSPAGDVRPDPDVGDEVVALELLRESLEDSPLPEPVRLGFILEILPDSAWFFGRKWSRKRHTKHYGKSRKSTIDGLHSLFSGLSRISVWIIAQKESVISL